MRECVLFVSCDGNCCASVSSMCRRLLGVRERAFLVRVGVSRWCIYHHRQGTNVTKLKEGSCRGGGLHKECVFFVCGCPR